MKLLQRIRVLQAHSSKEIFMRTWLRIVPAFLVVCLLPVCASALPDLVVSELRIEPSQPHAGELILIEATLSNEGTSSTQSSFFVEFIVDGRVIANRPIAENIRSGRTRQVSTEWLATAGSHDILIVVDPELNRVQESDEDNNNASLRLNVSLTSEALAAIGSLKVAVPSFQDLTDSGFLHIGEGVADKLIDRLSGAGVRVVARSELESIMRGSSLNPSLIADVAIASRLLDVDVFISGSVTNLEVHDSTLWLGFLSVTGAEVEARLSAHLVSAYTSESLATIAAEGHDEGATGFSLDLGGLLPLLHSDSSDICGGGLQTARSWYSVGQSIPMAYRNASSSGWFSIEISTSVGAFVKWLGWQFIDTGDCNVWYWDQRNTIGSQMNPGIYSAKLWDGTAYIAEVSFQIQPGISLSIPSIAEITVGSETFEDTVVGGALNRAIDELLIGLVGGLQDAAPLVEDVRFALESGGAQPSLKQGQIASVLPDGRIAINIGAFVGVAQDDHFEVLDVRNVITDPISLELLDYEPMGVKGELVIIEVRDRVSFGTRTTEFEPAVGDIVRQLLP